MKTILSENHQESIHNEAYYQKYNRQNLNHETLIFTENRPAQSLNGNWNFTVDWFDTGLRSDWNRLTHCDASGMPVPWDYDYDGGDLVTVPSCWNLAKPEYLYFEGSGWYAREFAYQPAAEDERVFLRVGAANYDAKIFLNEKFLGNHYGGSTPFCTELTGHLKGRNVLQICVNNVRTTDRVPMRNTDWYNYGGLYRDVELYRVPPTMIKNFKIYLVPDGSYCRIGVEAEVDGPAQDGPLTVELAELGVKEGLNVVGGKAAWEFEAHPELWSPNHPKLYQVKAEYQGDQIQLRVGFRRIEVRGKEIVLNGKPLFLRGVSVHEDDEQLGKVTNEVDLRRRFADAKELGCNFLRLAHYPHSELAAQLADELGFLLWEEIPVYWAIDFDNPATYHDAENQLLELIRRDQNRASVIIWSVGNENAATEPRLSFMSRLAKTAKSVDPTRLVSAACLVNDQKIKIEDPLTEYLDVIGLNEYYGWYKPHYEELIQLGQNSKPQKPVIITETGAAGLAGYHDADTVLFTEEHMADVYRKQVEFVKQLDYVKGITPWILYDFRTPRRVNRYQQGFNRKGLIASDKKTRKPAFYILQQFYHEKQVEERLTEYRS
jgi:beta-glucuronidase